MAAVINTEIFDRPSGNMRGTVTSMLTLGKKTSRLGHAFLFVNEAPQLTIDVPKRLTLDEIEIVRVALAEFADKVRELDLTR